MPATAQHTIPARDIRTGDRIAEGAWEDLLAGVDATEIGDDVTLSVLGRDDINGTVAIRTSTGYVENIREDLRVTVTRGFPLPRTCKKDRRTVAERMPQVPVVVTFLNVETEEVHTAHVSVGVGGFSLDVENALAREIGEAARQVTILTVGPDQS